MKPKTSSYTLDALPPLTAKQRAHLVELAKKPDALIATDDIPELTNDQLAEMRRAEDLYRPVKKQITARIDADVLDWLKSHGKGYQSRMNAILRREMLQNR
jgi:uncharacterized protein (DUF4415 family)